MREFASATIRYRKGPFVGMFIAVMCAAALITALGVLLESGLRAGVPPQRYAGAGVVVGAVQSIDVREDLDLPFSERVPLRADLVGRLAEVPGVDRVIGDVSVPVTVLADGRPLDDGRPVAGHGWSTAALTPFTLRAGEAPSGQGVVLDSGLAARAGVQVGDPIEIAVGATPARYTVTGIADQKLGRAAVLFFTDETARSLYGKPDLLDAIGVLTKGDPDAVADRIHAAVPAVAVYTGDERGDVEFLDVGQVRSQLILLSLAFAGTAMMIAMLVVSSTLGLSIQQRRREFALLRAVAATPRQIHRLIGAEILLVGGSAAVLGALPGLGVAYLLRAAFASVGMLPADFGLALSPLPAVAAVVLCLGTARLAGFIAARRAARIQPVEALREAEVEPKKLSKARLIAGAVAALLAVGSAALPVFLPGEEAIAGAAGSAFMMVLSVALLGPRFVTVAVRLIGGPLRAASPVGGYLAVANISANARRLSVVVTPLVLAITMASVQIFTQTTVDAEAADQADVGVVADYVVTAPSGLAPEVTEAVRTADGVEVATPIVRSQVFVRHLSSGQQQVSRYAAQGVSPAGLASTLDLSPIAGDVADLRGETVALSEMTAETLGVDVGGTIDLHLGDGTALKPTVVFLYDRGLGFGDVTLPHDLLAAHTTTRLDQSVLVRTNDFAAARSSLTALGAKYPGLVAMDRTALAAAGQAERNTQTWTNLIALFVILGYVAIAVVNTLVMATAARSREFALLRLVGTGRRQVTRMMRIESLIVVGIAIVIGSVAAIPPLVGVSIGMTGSPVPVIAPLACLTIVAVTAVLGLLAIGIPARRALRARPVVAIA